MDGSKVKILFDFFVQETEKSVDLKRSFSMRSDKSSAEEFKRKK